MLSEVRKNVKSRAKERHPPAQSLLLFDALCHAAAQRGLRWAADEGKQTPCTTQAIVMAGLVPAIPRRDAMPS
jgi:hypothetical protein